MPIRRAEVQKQAWVELNALAASRTLPPQLDGATIAPATRVFDLNGEELFLRVPLKRQGEGGLGFADLGTHPALGAVLLAVSEGVRWHESTILAEARKAAGKRIAAKADKVRFVAYSFPKVAVQFLAKGEELALLELFTWKQVPPRSDRSRETPPENFERWSFLEEQPAVERRRRAAAFAKRTEALDKLVARAKVPFDSISTQRFTRFLGNDVAFLLNDTRELHYSTRNTDHVPCYEVRGQQTNVWCVAASVQMLLDFYRYEYTQVRLATELGLGTLANPNGLPYSRDGDTVTVIERMSSNALDATMNTSPTWTEFRDEIRANRPLVSFVPGHARTVAGYTRSGLNGLGLSAFRGLLVYDPWPPNAGVITRWENFDSTTYRRTFTARVRLV